MDARKGFFVLLALSVTSLVSGYSNYRRVRPVSKTVYRQYFDKYRTYRNSYGGFNPNRRPSVRSLGLYFGGDFQLQRSLPRFKSGFQKGDTFQNKGPRGVMIRPIPIYRVPPPLRSFKLPSYRPNPIRCPKFETLVCSLAPQNVKSSKCFSLCRNGKPCYKPCSCTCIPFTKGKSTGSKLLPLGKKSTIPLCEKTHILRCKAQKYSTASDGLCAQACADGVCPISCNCQCVIDRLFFGGGSGGFRNNERGFGGTRGFQGGFRGGPRGGSGGGGGGGFSRNGLGVGGGFGGNGGGFGGNGGGGGGAFGGNGGGFGGNGFGGSGGFGGNGFRGRGGISGSGGFGGNGRGGAGGFGGNGRGGAGGFGGNGRGGASGFGGNGRGGAGGFGGNGFGNRGGIGGGAGFGGNGFGGAGGFGGNGFGGRGGFGENGFDGSGGFGENGFDGAGGFGGDGFGRGVGFNIGQGDNGFNGQGPIGGIGIDNGIEFGNGFDNGVGIAGGPGLGGGMGAGVGPGIDAGLGDGLGLGVGDGLGLGLGGGPGLGLEGGLVQGGGPGLSLGNGLDFENGLDRNGFDGGVGLGVDLSTDLGISNDVAMTDRDFRSFPNNGPGQMGGIVVDQGIPIDFSKLQAIDRLDFPLDGSQRIPEMLEPELSLMDSIPEMNGPALIDPGLGAGSGGQIFAMGAPEVGAVGVDPTALQELGGLVGGPFDPILDIGAGRAPPPNKEKNKGPKKVTETVDIKVDVIKKGGKTNKKTEKGNGKGRGADTPMSGSGFIPVGIPSGAVPSGGDLLPGDIVDPSAFLGGSGGGGRGGGAPGNGGMFDGGFVDAGHGGAPIDQGGLPPIGILLDGQQPGGHMNGAGAGGVPGEFGGGPGGNIDFRGGPQDALGIDAMAGVPPGIDLQGGHFEPEVFPMNGNQGGGNGKSGIIGFDGFQGHFDPQAAGSSGGLALDALPVDAGSPHIGPGGGDPAFDNNPLMDPMLQASNGFNEQMTFVDPTQPNNGHPGDLPINPGSPQGGISTSGGNINLDLASLLPADVLGGLDLNGGSNVNNKNFGGPGDHGPAGGVIGLADFSGGAAGDIGGASMGKGKETLDSCLSRGEKLWCDARASWGSTPGLQGWCNSNCQKGACNFERCACSCISSAEYDFRMGSSASQ